jgi:hypothetical protein
MAAPPRERVVFQSGAGKLCHSTNPFLSQHAPHPRSATATLAFFAGPAEAIEEASLEVIVSSIEAGELHLPAMQNLTSHSAEFFTVPSATCERVAHQEGPWVLSSAQH